MSAEPSSAGNAPDNCAEGRFVRDAPEPENVVAVAIPAVIVPAVSIVSLAVHLLNLLYSVQQSVQLCYQFGSQLHQYP